MYAALFLAPKSLATVLVYLTVEDGKSRILILQTILPCVSLTSIFLNEEKHGLIDKKVTQLVTIQ